MDKKTRIFLAIFFFAGLFFLIKSMLIGGFVLFAQTASSTPSVYEQQQELQKQLADIQNQIEQYEKELKSIQGQKNTLQNKINQLKKQQAALNLKIKATTLQINNLSGQISTTQTDINQNIAKSDRLKEQIGQFLQLIYERDSYSFLYILANKTTLSDIVSEAETYTQISQSLDGLLKETKDLNNQLTQQKDALSQQQDDAKNLLSIQSLQRQGVADLVNQQNNVLVQTKGKESNYQAALKDTQKKAQEIRDRLYQLLGVSKQITFGEAVQIAQWASSQTGVRPAFLLAVLTQESNLGKNVGTCNRPGDPPEKSWKVVMNPTRDQPPFIKITQELGVDPDITPVSCPMRDKNGNQIGWGGAMGPAQFIPSTWMGYRDRVAAITGKAANPWDIRDAFIASALKLAADGATKQSGEWAAAMRYFSGSTNSKYSFYGNSVVALAAQYQSDIDELNK